MKKEFVLPLPKANHEDSTGMTFTRECLQRVIAEYNESGRTVLVFKSFKNTAGLVDAIGHVTDLMIEDDELIASIKLLTFSSFKEEEEQVATAHLVEAKKLELAAGGMTSDKISIKGKSVIQDFRLRHVALVPDKVEVKRPSGAWCFGKEDLEAISVQEAKAADERAKVAEVVETRESKWKFDV